jgi:hypothetical protein
MPYQIIFIIYSELLFETNISFICGLQVTFEKTVLFSQKATSGSSVRGQHVLIPTFNLDRSVGGPQSRSRPCGVQRNLLSLRKLNVGRSALSPSLHSLTRPSLKELLSNLICVLAHEV